MDQRLKHQIGIILAIIVVFCGVTLIYNNIIQRTRDKPLIPSFAPEAPSVFEIKIGLIYNLMNQNRDYEDIVEIFQQDFHEYLASLELDQNYTLQKIYVEYSTGTNVFQEKLWTFRAMGTNFIIGGDDEGQILDSLPYIQSNNLVLLSPAITINRSLVSSSNFFSLIYNEPDQMETSAQAILDKGYKATIVLQTDADTRSSNRDFLNNFMEYGGIILARKDANASLDKIETLVQDALKQLSSEELFIVVNSLDLTRDLREHPLLANLTWMTFGNPDLFYASWWDEYGDGFSIKSVRPVYVTTSQWENVNERFYSRTGRNMTNEISNVYDGCWIFSLSFLETKNHHVGPNLEWIPRVALSYEGLTGNITFNSDGDRGWKESEVYEMVSKIGRSDTGLPVAEYYGNYPDVVYSRQGNWSIYAFTDNINQDSRPKINNGSVAWLRYDGDDTEIFIGNGTTEAQLTDDSFRLENLCFHNGQAAWSDRGEIFWFDGFSINQLTDDSTDAYGLQMHNGHIVWGELVGQYHEIFIFNGSAVIQLTDDDVDHLYPKIHNGQATWYGLVNKEAQMEVNTSSIYVSEIFFYNGSSVIQLTNNNQDDSDPQIHKGQVVWYGHRDNDDEIFHYNGSSVTQITNNDIDDYDPHIHDGQIVWVGNDGYDCEIFYFDGSSVIQITDNEEWDGNPLINNGQIVWGGYDGNDYETFIFDGESVTQLSDNNENDLNHNIDQGQVVWQSSGLIYIAEKEDP